MKLLRRGNRGDDVRKVQLALTSLGYNTAGTKGIFGDITLRAVKNFQKDNGLIPDGVVGDKTREVLFGKDTILEKEVVEEGISDKVGVLEKPLWLSLAFKEIGVSEHTDEERVHQYWRDSKLSGLAKFPATDVPWCSGLVCAMIENSGIRSARTDGAKNWLDWGEKIDTPEYGCIVVFTRRGGAHVGFCVGVTDNGDLQILGGNQGDAVNIKTFKKGRVSGYRKPEGYTLHPAPIVNNPAEVSTNEE